MAFNFKWKSLPPADRAESGAIRLHDRRTSNILVAMGCREFVVKHFALLMLFACAAPAAATSVPLVLAHATVIDGSGAQAEPDMTVVIADGRIDAIYAGDDRRLPKDAHVEDLRGRYIIPGLIDAHVHITDVEPDIAHYQPFLRALLMGGVTSVRDMAGDDRLLAYLARQANSGAFAAPDIFYAALLSGPSFFAEDPRVQAASEGMPLGDAPWMQAITASTDIPLAVARAKGTGATGIKLYANLPVDLVDAIAAEAHRQGLQVWTHATIFPARPSDAVNAGADTISHSPYLVWEAAASMPTDYGVRAKGDFAHIRPDAAPILALFDAMQRHGTILDATLNVFRDEAQHHPEKVGVGIAPWSYAVTRLAHEHGVLIDAGTDGSGLPDKSDNPDLDALPEVHKEMALLVEHCGFTPLEAIRAATQISAMAAGQGANRGTIAPGKRADMVVLSADPSQDIRNTRRIAFVVKDGQIFRAGNVGK
jgi:imidazolonepropionase-like amidohydrolase